MNRFSSSIVLGLTAVLAIACGGGNKTSSLGAGPDGSATDDAGANGGSSNGGTSNGGTSNGGTSNGGTTGMDAAAPDASSNSPDAASDAGPTGSNDSGVVDDGGSSDAGDAGDAGAVCGNGDVEGSEGCDDGNTDSGDGCTADCWAVELTQTVTAGPGLALAITDDAYNGTQGTMACVNLVAGAWTGADISSVTVQLGMAHTWVGDLVIKLISPANTVVTLMSRPGLVETVDDGTNGVGENSNLSIAAPITFDQSALVSAESMGATLADAQVVCTNDAVCSFAPNNGAAAAGNLAAFNGQESPGTWKLCVGDSGAADTGSIDAVTLTINH